VSYTTISLHIESKLLISVYVVFCFTDMGLQ
jgi:hypothetical protein